jgi:anhydro-N-acetylmuramic acid kinase
MKIYEVVGLMSGTSLDGLDIACVRFSYDSCWQHEVMCCESIDYDEQWKDQLKKAMQLSGLELKKLDLAYGDWLGSAVNSFIEKYKISPELIVSHGHTIFHQPAIGLTMQIGDGYRIFKRTGIKTVFDLRSLDVALGGQGAPLVPIGDKLLFSQYDYCLNLGGFSNISFEYDGQRIAFDVGPVNTVLNHLASRLGFEYDKNGALAKAGKMLPELLERLNELPYYQSPPPKSLGIEWVKEQILPMLGSEKETDLLHTFCHHIADQIILAVNLNSSKNKRPEILITGGGAKNAFLIELLQQKAGSNYHIILPDVQLIDFKEAIIFGFLGLLKVLGQHNCLASVTGASTNSTGGIVIENTAC